MTVDLTIIPQLGQQIAGQHMTPEQIRHAQDDWADFTIPGPQDDTWTVAVAHFRDDMLKVTSTVRIAKSVTRPTPEQVRTTFALIDGDDQAESISRHPARRAQQPHLMVVAA